MRSTALDAWHAVAKARDPAGLDALLAEDVVFHSPVVHTPQRGRALTKKYLAAALAVLANDSFRYVAEWVGANSAVLEFVTTVEGVEIDGADFISWSDAQQIVQFKVMARPLKAINLLHQRMAAQLAADAAGV